MEWNAAEESKKTGKRKRGFLKGLICFFCVLLVIVLVCGVIGIVYARYYRTHYKISFYKETSRKVNSNVRIAVISDIHNREYGKDNEELLKDLQALRPDLILFAGDMVILEQDDYQSALDLVSNAAKIAPCYGVLGNHESERIYYRDDKELPGKFENAGLVLLRNAQEKIQIGQNTIQLFGLEGTPYGFEQYGGREFMNGAEWDPDAYIIVMNHIPILFKEQLSEYDFDLGIAGHVHGGLVNLPFIGGLYTKEEGFFPTFTAGEYILDGQRSLIISAGLGDSGFFPPRINNAPELVIIDINRY